MKVQILWLKKRLVSFFASWITLSNLKFWHNHGEIAGHSNIVFNVTVLYDRAIQSPDSQALVEKPSVYILGRSKSNVAEQVSFSSYRSEDLPKLDAIFLERLGISVHCVPRFCVGESCSGLWMWDTNGRQPSLPLWSVIWKVSWVGRVPSRWPP